MSGYPGSKGQAGVWQRIIGQMPPHSIYVEPFFGSGQIFWHKRRAASSILIDRLPPARLPSLVKAGALPSTSVITYPSSQSDTAVVATEAHVALSAIDYHSYDPNISNNTTATQTPKHLAHRATR